MNDIDEARKFFEQENAKSKGIIVKEDNLPTVEKLEMPDFKPELDKSKDLEDQASDVVKVIGAQKASQNEDFIGKVADNFSKGVITEQETKQMQRERLMSEEYFLKWQAVLNIARVKEPQGIGLMRAVVVLMIVPYFVLRFVDFIFMIISNTFEAFNELFNAVFGDGGKILVDANGKPVLNDKTKKPYKEKTGYNLFAKLLLGLIIGFVISLIIVGIVRAFTGFDLFGWIRELVNSN